MTALAIALVLCCAMVCGTLILLRRMHARDAAAAEFEHRLSAVIRVDERRAAEVTALRQDVDQLRAQVALRSM